MSQHVSDPPESVQQPGPLSRQRIRISSVSVIALLVLVSLLLLLFSGQILSGLLELKNLPGTSSASANATSGVGAAPFVRPGGTPLPTLALPGGRSVLFQNADGFFLVSTTDQTVQPLSPPDYSAAQTVQPLLTSTGQLIYTGKQGIWLIDVLRQQPPLQLAQLDPNTTVTSLVLSQDEKKLAWSTEPIDGNGSIKIYAGTLNHPQQVWQQSASACPCYRLFSFLPETASEAEATLLLTNDRGSSQAVQYGLWSLSIEHPTEGPRLLMDDDQQGPLALAPTGNALLYSTYEGIVARPNDGSIPYERADLPYANSLGLGLLEGSPLSLKGSQLFLPEQHDLPNSALYHWVTTPMFSPDGTTLAYVEFSSDSLSPYGRHSSLYLARISETDGQVQVSEPSLFALSTHNLLELGPWLDNHIVTLDGDGEIYALDVESGSLATLAEPGSYLRILGVIDR